MTTTEVALGCVCGSIGSTELRQCPVDHHIWRGDKRLTSVGRIISLLPSEPCSSCGAVGYRDHLPGCRVFQKIENARERGAQVDKLFSAWVVGKLDTIPVGIRSDARALFLKLVTWFNTQEFESVESQVLIGDDEVGGVLDLRLNGETWDLKCTYDVTTAHILQVAGYRDVQNNGDVLPVGGGGIIHVTERFPEPVFRRLTDNDLADWWVLRNYWQMTKERRLISEKNNHR